ncbi:MAG: winged-helix domain-containing protein [Rhodoglobus sp.]
MTTLRRVVTVTTPSNSAADAVIAELAGQGIALSSSSDGSSALIAIGHSTPHLVIVPTDVVDIDPLTLIDALARRDIPVLVALANGPSAPAIAVEALDRGAARIIGLPLSSIDLADALRRFTQDSPERLIVGDLVMDIDAHRVTVRGSEVHLSPREFTLLRRLLESPRHLVSLDELERLAASDSASPLTNARVMVARIRRKLEAGASSGDRLVETVRGVGYRIAEDRDIS